MFTDHLKRTFARLLGLARTETRSTPNTPDPRQAGHAATAASFVLDRRPGLSRSAVFVGGPMDGYEAEVCQELHGPAAHLIAVPVSAGLLAGLAEGDPRHDGTITSVAVYERSQKWGVARYIFVRSVHKETLR
jgi:hypothetical protein